MREARRATAALAALVGLAVGMAALLVYHLGHFLWPQLDAVARFCGLSSVASSMDRATTIPLSAWLAVGLLIGGVAFAFARLILLRQFWADPRVPLAALPGVPTGRSRCHAVGPKPTGSRSLLVG